MACNFKTTPYEIFNLSYGLMQIMYPHKLSYWNSLKVYVIKFIEYINFSM